ncbi:MAG: hypothetical protein WAV20_26155, partial [Blastocatellia bacterium]
HSFIHLFHRPFICGREFDRSQTEANIHNIATRVKQLRRLNGATIKVNGEAHVEEVDALNVTRVRIHFEMRSYAFYKVRGDLAIERCGRCPGCACDALLLSFLLK